MKVKGFGAWCKVYTVCKLKGKSYQEVGDELGISTSTIRNHIVTSKKIIKEFFIKRHLAIIFIATQVFGHLK